MTIQKLKGIKRYKHKITGRWYSYHRKSGIRLEPPHAFGTDEFIQAYLDAQSKLNLPIKTLPTLQSIIVSYLNSSDFENLSYKTKKDYRLQLRKIESMKDIPLYRFDKGMAVKLRNKLSTKYGPRTVNYVLQVLSVIFNHAIDNCIATENPIRGVKKVRSDTGKHLANRAWSKVEMQIIINNAPEQLKLPILIGRWTGMRQGDILKLQNGNYANGKVSCVTAKRNVKVVHVCPEPLKEILDAWKPLGSSNICLNSYGKPWTSDGFRASFRKYIGSLEKQKLIDTGITFHGLRTSLAEELANHGFERDAIAHILGHRSSGAAAHYARNASLEQLSLKAAQLLTGTPT